MSFRHVLVVFGTRPEAIKMAPVVQRLKASTRTKVTVCVSAQHREMLDQVLDLFGIMPDFDLDIMRQGQTLASVTSSIVEKVSGVMERVKPDLVLVHGDTTTAFASALAAFYQKVAIGHVEAGLRSGNIHSPWPEEMNRRFVSEVASLHFAPTEAARENLIAEGISSDCIWVTGNSVIDALMSVRDKIRNDDSVEPIFEENGTSRRVVLVTGHRRENFGQGIEGVCRALKRLTERHDVDIVYPVHPNPNVMLPVHHLLDGIKGIHLVEPLDYKSFVALMSKAHIIITDSGGVQEEAPSLGKPVLVMRDTTERPEAVAAGTVMLVGVDEDKIFEQASRLLTDQEHYAAMSAAHNPYGDGQAAERIVRTIEGRAEVHEL